MIITPEVLEISIQKALEIQEKEIIELIDNDVEYQKKRLTGNFKTDKPIKWRIIGFEDLKKRIQQKT